MLHVARKGLLILDLTANPNHPNLFIFLKDFFEELNFFFIQICMIMKRKHAELANMQGKYNSRFKILFNSLHISKQHKVQ